jgi:Uncharacterised protein family (UPF0236)
MTNGNPPKDWSQLSEEELAVAQSELIKEVARRRAGQSEEVMTLSAMELAAENLKWSVGKPTIEALLSRAKPETQKAKACPRCGQRTRVKTKDRPRTVISLSGPVTFTRHYHYCEDCRFGFYPRDHLLGLPEEGDLSEEMEKRVLDFAINEPFESAAQRWGMHYTTQPLSAHLLQQVVKRVGRLCEQSDQTELQARLLPQAQPAEVLVVQNDGSHLPMRGSDEWKEAKVAVLYRLENRLKSGAAQRGFIEQPRYAAVLGKQAEFSLALKSALAVEQAEKARAVLWLGDGAPSNWTLAHQLQPLATQILDWYHALEHAMDCGKILFGEQSPWLTHWQQRAEQLLASGNINDLIEELLGCMTEATNDGLAAINNLVRYYRTNQSRMKYHQYRQAGWPIGSGIVESAHRHVLQTRMKLAGQRWSPTRARRMVRLRAAYRTAGATRFYQAVRQSHPRLTINYSRSN